MAVTYFCIGFATPFIHFHHLRWEEIFPKKPIDRLRWLYKACKAGIHHVTSRPVSDVSDWFGWIFCGHHGPGGKRGSDKAKSAVQCCHLAWAEQLRLGHSFVTCVDVLDSLGPCLAVEFVSLGLSLKRLECNLAFLQMLQLVSPCCSCAWAESSSKVAHRRFLEGLKASRWRGNH